MATAPQPPVSGRTTVILGGALLAFGAATVLGAPARAVPSFAQQTGQPCQACHVGGFGPQLTPFGRAFKLGGYTLRSSASVPISAMAVASYTSTKKRPATPLAAWQTVSSGPTHRSTIGVTISGCPRRGRRRTQRSRSLPQ